MKPIPLSVHDSARDHGKQGFNRAWANLLSLPRLKLPKSPSLSVPATSPRDWSPSAPPEFYTSSDDCETPKGKKHVIPEPACPPSPPRKRRATAKGPGPPPGGFFCPPDLELFLSTGNRAAGLSRTYAGLT